MPLTARFASNVYKEADTTDHFSAISKSQGKVGEEEVAIARLFLPFSFFLFGVDERGSKYFFLHRAIDFVQTEFEIVGALFVFIFDPTFSCNLDVIIFMIIVTLMNILSVISK